MKRRDHHDGHGPHDHPHASQGHYLKGPAIEPLQLAGNENVADLIDQVFGRSGFNARRLAEAAGLFSRMLDGTTTVGLTLAGAMTPIGMSGPLIDLIRNGFVDFIISTGANLYHDMHRPFDLPMCQGTFNADDNELADSGVARIYDVFIGDDSTLMATDKMVLRAARRMPDRPISTADFHYMLGQEIREIAPAPEKSLVAVAAECEVPIYTSSPGDSSIGMNLIVPHLFRRPMQVDFIRDIIETAAIVRDADKNGVIHVGGGSPKNFYLQTQPTLHQILMDESKGGHDYFIQITTDAPHWGGLSGATPQEARSWGKIKDATINNVVVYACSSIAVPLLTQYARIRNKPRPLKRLYKRLPELVEVVRRSAAKSPEVAQSLKRYFDVPLERAAARGRRPRPAARKAVKKAPRKSQPDTASAAIRARKSRGKGAKPTVDRRR